MRRKVIILDAAKPDFQEIKTYVLFQFGREIWNQVFEEFKNTINDIGLYPEAGAEIDELKELFQEPFRIRLVRQTRIVYEYDDKEVLIHMFIHTMRDFRAHLLKRLLKV
ncbi:MAG: type II toxin-antitoxin system RelE/ParE family toxin [Oxalobacteraceae bacterium]|nr:MAG: type II toxin-antitoxin system RelE/ParE family toxin [Oxalobacteraceae bacterium]